MCKLAYLTQSKTDISFSLFSASLSKELLAPEQNQVHQHTGDQTAHPGCAVIANATNQAEISHKT